ncbi:MAG: GGDEF domain-containing protein [Acidimicrobiales bacterium]
MLAPLVGSALLAAQTHGSATALAELDALTGLANRRSLDRDITALRATHVASYVMIDVDHFKNFNDTNGHAAGDVALQIRGAGDRRPCAARGSCLPLGGEEFCVLLPGASAAEAGLVAERVRAAVEEATIPGGEKTNPAAGSRFRSVLPTPDRG